MSPGADDSGARTSGDPGDPGTDLLTLVSGLGVQLDGAPSGAAWREICRKIEGLGYSTVYVPDHFGDQLAPVDGEVHAAQRERPRDLRRVPGTLRGGVHELDSALLHLFDERVEVLENSIKATGAECWGVLDDDIGGVGLTNEASVVRPEAAALTVDACSLADDTNVLTWEATDEDVDAWCAVSVDAGDVGAHHAANLIRG